MTLPQLVSMHEDMWKAQTRYLHVAIMCATAVFCYSPVAQCVQCVLELPEGVALEIEACDVVRGVKQGYARDLCRACVEAGTHPQATSCAMESASSSIGTMLFELRLVRPPC